jgi:LAS superfamily LD-carboxypeptidase LdcB
MATTKTYEPVTNLPNLQITKCQQMLANHMQCWKAGDFLVTVTTDTPTDENPAAQTITQYQKCRAHASSEMTQDAQTAADEAALAAAQAVVVADTAPVVTAKK